MVKGQTASSIPALQPRSAGGAQFVVYADCCSGKPGTQVERNLRSVNQAIARLRPAPEFICFPGDHIAGNTKDYAELRRQWKYFLETEMAWLDQRKTPLYSTTSNHNTYDKGSEAVFREVFPGLPQNGPDDQKGLSYFVRRGNLLLVAVNTNFSGFADETRPTDKTGHGYVETEWLDRVLSENQDAVYKFVSGHVPALPVNGYAQYPLWRMIPARGEAFWKVLVKHKATAYLASHVIAFDVQSRHGVLQITSGGAGTQYGPGGFMPGRSEYLHAVQVAVDSGGLRYQVLDSAGRVRESLEWPPPVSRWQILRHVEPLGDLPKLSPGESRVAGFRIRATSKRSSGGSNQTLVCGWDPSEPGASVWIGFEGEANRLTVRMRSESGGPIEAWTGPSYSPLQPFQFDLLLHGGMGPGGVLFRRTEREPWNSFTTASSSGLERVTWPRSWALGNGPSGPTDEPFRGENLELSWFVTTTGQAG